LLTIEILFPISIRRFPHPNLIRLTINHRIAFRIGDINQTCNWEFLFAIYCLKLNCNCAELLRCW
jgi:hypothetical protein